MSYYYYYYDLDLSRNIMVDIRYVIFIMDKYAGAQNLTDELKLAHPNRGNPKRRNQGRESLGNEGGIWVVFETVLNLDLNLQTINYYLTICLHCKVI